MSSWENFANKSIRYLFYVLFFFTPIVMWTKTSEVFEFNKMLFVYAITILVSSSWLIKSVATKKFTLAKTPIDIPVVLFLLSQVASTIFSIDRHTSLWGYYSRFYGGLASTISFIVLFYAFITHLGNDKKAQQNIIWSVITSSILVSLYAIMEHFGIDKNVWVQDVQNRVFSTMGQPNWLSAYLLAVLPISIILAFYSEKKWLKLFYAAVSFLIFLSILYTKSRSGIGATIIILVILFLSSIYKLSKSKSKFSVREFLGGILLLLITVFLVGTPWTPTPQSIQHASVYGGPIWPAAEKYLNKIRLSTQLKPVQIQLLSETDKVNYQRAQQGLRVGGSDSMEIRNIVWQGAIELTKRYPVLGTGVDTFGYSYYWVRPASHNMLSEWDFLYNRAHNEYLNFAATTGLLGLSTYLVMIGSFIYIFVRSIKLKNPLAFPMLLGFISIMITNYFGFSVVAVALLFFLFPAIAISTSSLYSTRSFPVKLDQGISVFVILAATLYLLSNTYHAWSADLAYSTGKTDLLFGPSYLSDAINNLEKSVKLEQSEPLYKSQLSEAQAQAAMYINEELKALPASTAAEVRLQYQNARDKYAEAALQNSEKAIDMNPYQTNYYKTRAKVGLFLATYAPNYYNDVINSLLKVSEKAPTDAKVIYNIGLVYLNMQKIDDAKAAFRKAIELKPDYSEAIIRLDQLNATKSAAPKK